MIRPLTPTQERIARLVAQGYSYGTIATEMNRSRHTVRTHIRNIAMLLDYDPQVSYYNAVLIWATHHLR